jgi:hypothetical protein
LKWCIGPRSAQPAENCVYSAETADVHSAQDPASTPISTIRGRTARAAEGAESVLSARARDSYARASPEGVTSMKQYETQNHLALTLETVIEPR